MLPLSGGLRRARRPGGLILSGRSPRLMLPGFSLVSGFAPKIDFARTDNKFQSSHFVGLPLNCNFGEEHSSRIIIAAVSYHDNTALNGLSIGGVSATRRVNSVNTAPGTDDHTEIWTAPVPTGTTGNVVTSSSASDLGSFSLVLYRAVGLAGEVPYDTLAVATEGLSLQGPIDCPYAGLILAANFSSSAETIAWIGVGQDFNANNFTVGFEQFGTDQAGLNVGVSGSVSNFKTLAAASWGAA